MTCPLHYYNAADCLLRQGDGSLVRQGDGSLVSLSLDKISFKPTTGALDNYNVAAGCLFKTVHYRQPHTKLLKSFGKDNVHPQIVKTAQG